MLGAKVSKSKPLNASQPLSNSSKSSNNATALACGNRKARGVALTQPDNDQRRCVFSKGVPMRFSFRRVLPRAAKAHCPLCEANLLEQARQLLDAGFYVAAVATARCELESRLKAAAAAFNISPADNTNFNWRPAHTAKFLNQNGMLTIKRGRRIAIALRRAGEMIHANHRCNCVRARWFISEVETAVAELNAAVARAAGTTRC